MDLVLLGVLLLSALVLVVIRVRSDMAWRSNPSRSYQSVFSVGSVGLLLTGLGLAGGDMRGSRGWFRGIEWADGPVWWQVGIGLAMLALAVVWARRIVQQTT
jgi:hypothetical protein